MPIVLKSRSFNLLKPSGPVQGCNGILYLHNELNYLYCLPNIVRVIKARREIGWACSTFGGEGRRILGFGGENLGEETTGETKV